MRRNARELPPEKPELAAVEHTWSSKIHCRYDICNIKSHFPLSQIPFLLSFAAIFLYLRLNSYFYHLFRRWMPFHFFDQSSLQLCMSQLFSLAHHRSPCEKVSWIPINVCINRWVSRVSLLFVHAAGILF